MTSKPSNLEQREAIRDLLYTYCYTIDAGAFDAWCDLFVEDGIFEPLPGQQCKGRDAIREWVNTALADAPPRKHLTINPLIAVDEDGASVMSNVLVVLDGEEGATISLAGRYEDALVRSAEGWRFQHRKVHFDIAAADLGLAD